MLDDLRGLNLSDAELERRGKLLDAYNMACDVERRRCEADFIFFAKQFWHTVEPNTRYVHGKHIEAIVDHLNACLPQWIPSNDGGKGYWKPGQIRELVITMPFRHMKSTLISVLWPAFVWTVRPEFRWLFSSYSLSLATRDTMRMRVVINSPHYQRLWGKRYRLLSDQNRKDRFFNTSMGYRMVASRDSGATGEGGDAVIVDDAHNVREADSKVIRDATISWWRESMGSRLNDPDLSFKIVVGQRVHQFDLANYCIESGYEVLNLPARYDPDQVKTSCIGWRDWRGTPGERLWPERFSESALVAIETSIGPYAVACQLQQNPTPRGGAFIKREWFKRIDVEAAKSLKGTITWVRSWDLALSKTGNGTASVEVGQDAGGTTYLRRGQFWHEDWVVSEARILEIGKWERNQVHVEAMGTTYSAAKKVAEILMGHCLVTLQEEKSNKVSEAIPWIAAAQAGQIVFIEEGEDTFPFLANNRGPWIEHFLEVFSGWIPDPTVEQRDDEVDAVSLGYSATRGKIPLLPGDVPDEGPGNAGRETFHGIAGRY